MNRPSPDSQVLAAMRSAKRAGLPADEAWMLAVAGHVCDSYASRRGNPPATQPTLDGPPNLRTAHQRRTGELASTPTAVEQRCAGCRYVIGAGEGLARCGLYEVPVYAGVLWPPRTDDRREWKAAILSTAAEWRAAYAEVSTPISDALELTNPGGGDVAIAGHEPVAA